MSKIGLMSTIRASVQTAIIPTSGIMAAMVVVLVVA
jgi:hypothetical protein